MKRMILPVALLFLYSCNNSGPEAGKPGNDTLRSAVPEKEVAPVTETTPDTASTTTPAPAASGTTACTRMIFFQPGAEVGSGGRGRGGKANARKKQLFKYVEEKGGYTIAHVTGSTTDAGEKGKVTALDYEYKCDGKRIYFDFSSMFRTKEKQSSASFVSTLISFPINVKAGQQLPDDSGRMTSQRGDRKMVMKYTFKDRKVSAQEELITPAGKWKCYKISNTVHIDVDIPGMDEKAKLMMKQMQAMAKTASTIWFDPDFGIVKMEMYMNDQLMSRNEVIAVKR